MRLSHRSWLRLAALTVSVVFVLIASIESLAFHESPDVASNITAIAVKTIINNNEISLLQASDVDEPIILYSSNDQIFGTPVNGGVSGFITEARYEFGDLPYEDDFALTAAASNLTLPLTNEALWHYRIGVRSAETNVFIFTESNIVTGEFNTILIDGAESQIIYTDRDFGKQMPLMPLGW